MALVDPASSHKWRVNRLRIWLTCALAVGASATLHAEPKRNVPDYDGRGNADSHASRGILWVPKVLLWPIATTHDYVVRKPLGALFRTAEHHRWAARLREFVTFGPENESFLVPTVVYEFGFKPSVGLFLRLADLGVKGHDLRVHGATWGPDWLSGVVVDRYTWSRETSISVRGSFVRRPDFLFLGIGPDVTRETRSRYGRQRFEARTMLAQKLGNESKLALSGGVQSTSFRAGGYGTDPALEERIADGTIPSPPGFGESYATAFQRLDIVLDSRAPRPAPGTGGYLEAHTQRSEELGGMDRSWIEYGGTIGGAVDLEEGRQRTVTLQVGADFVDSFHGEVPFDQLAIMDPNLMPGFLEGWATGRSSVGGQIAYTWPVAVWTDGALRLSAGNAFGPHLSGFSAGQLRLSAEIGLASIGARTSGFELALGVGTTTFDQGTDIDCVRIALRSRRGL